MPRNIKTTGGYMRSMEPDKEGEKEEKKDMKKDMPKKGEKCPTCGMLMK